MNHVSARAVLLQAWPLALAHRVRTPMASLCLQSVCCLETGYGNWPPGPMSGSNNWGSIQSLARPLPDGSAPPGTAWTTDTHPTAIRGKNVSYPQLFRTYPTPLDGCVDVLRWFAHQYECLDEADSGVVLRFSTAMRKARYYEGFGTTEAERILHHAQAVYKDAQLIATANGEPFCLAMGEPVATPITPGDL